MEGWNPVQDIKDDWAAASNSVAGRLKVLLFYSFIWMGIPVTMVQFFVPNSMGWGCIAESTDDTTLKGFIGALIRQISVYGTAFGLCVARGRTTMSNLQFLVGVMTLCYADAFVHADSMAGKCFDDLFGQWPIFLGWPILSLICAYVEQHYNAKNGTPAETESLVV